MLFNNLPGNLTATNISIMNCDYNLAPNELGPIIICVCRGQHNFSQSNNQCRTELPVVLVAHILDESMNEKKQKRVMVVIVIVCALIWRFFPNGLSEV
jgi:hypothetical protein